RLAGSATDNEASEDTLRCRHQSNSCPGRAFSEGSTRLQDYLVSKVQRSSVGRRHPANRVVTPDRRISAKRSGTSQFWRPLLPQLASGRDHLPYPLVRNACPSSSCPRDLRQWLTFRWSCANWLRHVRVHRPGRCDRVECLRLRESISASPLRKRTLQHANGRCHA